MGAGGNLPFVSHSFVWSCGPDRTAFPDSIHTWPGKILMFFRAGSGTLPAASEQPQPGQEELPGSLEPVQNQLLLSRAQVT